MFLHPTPVYSPVLSCLFPLSNSVLHCCCPPGFARGAAAVGWCCRAARQLRVPATQLRSILFHTDESTWEAFWFNLRCFRSVTAKAKKSASFRRDGFTNRKGNFLCWDEPVHLSDGSGPSLAAFSPPAQLPAHSLCWAPSLCCRISPIVTLLVPNYLGIISVVYWL